VDTNLMVEQRLQFTPFSMNCVGGVLVRSR